LGDGFELRGQAQLGDRADRMKHDRFQLRIDVEFGQSVMHKLDGVKKRHLVEAVLVVVGEITARGAETVSAWASVDHD